MGVAYLKIRKMKAKRFVSEDLLMSIDVLNTLNGGVSEHQLALKQFPDHREVRVKVPGLNEENLKAEINDNILSVFYNFRIQSDKLRVEVPKVVYNKAIPYFVDAAKITAGFEDDVFVVTLPFNSLEKGYYSDISAGE
jgi:hypothetical protein